MAEHRTVASRARVAARLARRQVDRAKHATLERAGRPPIVVMTWSKTGSSTLHRTLARSHLGRPTYSTHELDDGVEERSRINDLTGEHAPVGERHLAGVRVLRAALADPGRPMSFVTAVRDPVSRGIASFFQAYRATGVVEPYAVPTAADVAELDAQLHAKLPTLIESTDRWFDRQPLALLGIDLFAHPFDHEAGWSRLTRDRFDLVVLRTDRLDEVAPAALRALTGRRVRRVRSVNVANTKPYAAYRRAVLDQFHLHPTELAAARRSRTFRHFFSEAEQARLADAWARPGLR